MILYIIYYDNSIDIIGYLFLLYKYVVKAGMNSSVIWKYQYHHFIIKYLCPKGGRYCYTIDISSFLFVLDFENPLIQSNIHTFCGIIASNGHTMQKTSIFFHKMSHFINLFTNPGLPIFWNVRSSLKITLTKMPKVQIK